MTLGINPLPFDAVALATLVLQSGCAPHARARGKHACPAKLDPSFCGCTSGAECQSWRDCFLIFNQQHNQYELVPVGAAGSGGRCWCGDGRGVSPEPGGATAGKWRWAAERETREERNLWVQMDPGQGEGEGCFINGKETERKEA